jgi:5'(3')-deoxyribonucleotidase
MATHGSILAKGAKAKHVLLDVDGVVADFIRSVENALQYKFSEGDKKKWNVLSALSKEKRNEALTALSGPLFWLNLPLINGAKEGVRYLEDAGHKITWVTSPWPSCEAWGAARTLWLNEHFNVSGKGQEIKILSDKSGVGGDALIDDKPANILAWAGAHPSGHALLYDSPNNQECPYPHRITWQTIHKYF